MSRIVILATLALTLAAVPAAADPVAVNPTGDAHAEYVAVSGTGDAAARVAISVLGTCHGIPCADAGATEDAEAYWLALSGLGNASAMGVAVSGTGTANSTDAFWSAIVAVSGAGHAHHAVVAASALGDAGTCEPGGPGYRPRCDSFLAFSGTGDAEAGNTGVSGTGHASSTEDPRLLFSGCDAASAHGVEALCVGAGALLP